MNTTPFNVLSNASRDSMSTVVQVSQMLSAPGVSKSERKQILRALNKTRQLTSKAQARLALLNTLNGVVFILSYSL